MDRAWTAINVEMNSEFYFGDTCDGNDDNEFCKINIVF